MTNGKRIRSILKWLAVPLVALGVAILLVELFLNFDLKEPPRFSPERTALQVEASTLLVPVDIPLRGIQAKLSGNLRELNPLIEGSTQALFDNALADFLGSDELRNRPKEKCRPITIAETITERVRCRDVVKNPKKFAKVVGKCLGSILGRVINVSRTITKQVQQCTPLKFVAQPKNILYRAEFESLSLDMTGNVVRATMRIPYSLKLEKGALSKGRKKGSCKPVIIAKADIKLIPRVTNGRLKTDSQVMKLDFEHNRDCRLSGVSETVIKALTKAFDKGIKKTLNNLLKEKIAEAIGQAEAGLGQVVFRNFKLPVPFDVWARLNPQRYQLSGLTDGKTPEGKSLHIAVGLTARPSIHVSKEPAADEPSTIPFDIVKPASRFRLVPQGVVSLSFMSEEVTKVLNAYVSKNFPEVEFESLSTDIYQSGDRLAIGLRIKGYSWFNASGSIYLTAKPDFDPVKKAVFLSDLKFDVETSVFLAKSAAWLFNSPIVEYAEKKLRFPVDKQLASVLTTFENFERTEDFGTVAGQLRKLSVGQIWLDNDNLNIAVIAEGKASLKVKSSFLERQ